MKHNKFSLKGWLMIAASLALTVMSFATPALAQQPTGAIEGTITDQSGAVLASAKISITEKATGRVIEVATNSAGYFVARALQPGVIVRDGETIDPTKTNAYRAAPVNGSSGTGTRVQIDGIDVTDETVGTTSANISTDAVQEFQLSRANFDLSTSLTTSGAINIVSRGGSNEFHGAGFYFWRSDRLAARQDFLDEKPPFRRQHRRAHCERQALLLL